MAEVSSLDTEVMVADQPTGGMISLSQPIETVHAIVLQQSTAGQSFDLPPPNDAAFFHGVDIVNAGTVDVTVEGIAIPFGMTKHLTIYGSNWFDRGASDQDVGAKAALRCQAPENYHDSSFANWKAITLGNVVKNQFKRSVTVSADQNGFDIHDIGDYEIWLAVNVFSTGGTMRGVNQWTPLINGAVPVGQPFLSTYVRNISNIQREGVFGIWDLTVTEADLPIKVEFGCIIEGDRQTPFELRPNDNSRMRLTIKRTR